MRDACFRGAGGKNSVDVVGLSSRARCPWEAVVVVSECGGRAGRAGSVGEPGDQGKPLGLGCVVRRGLRRPAWAEEMSASIREAMT